VKVILAGTESIDWRSLGAIISTFLVTSGDVLLLFSRSRDATRIRAIDMFDRTRIDFVEESAPVA